jgi:hypothetical protein
MGLNAGRAFLHDVTWEEFEKEFYAEYPAMKTIIDGGFGFVIMKLIGSGVNSKEGQFERQGTYGNLKFRHPGLSDKGHPIKRWATKPKGKYSMKISVGGYLIDRRDNGGREYNIYIYPPDYTKNSNGEPWIGAYMTGVDGFTAERAIKFARDVIRDETSNQVVASVIKKREVNEEVMEMIRRNPALATKFPAAFKNATDNLSPNFDEMINEKEIDNMESEEGKEEIEESANENFKTINKDLKDMTMEELKKEITRLES